MACCYRLRAKVAWWAAQRKRNPPFPIAHQAVRWRSAAVLGTASIAAAVGGAQVAVSLPEATLRKLFAVLLLLTAAQIAWRARRKQP